MSRRTRPAAHHELRRAQRLLRGRPPRGLRAGLALRLRSGGGSGAAGTSGMVDSLRGKGASGTQLTLIGWHRQDGGAGEAVCRRSSTPRSRARAVGRFRVNIAGSAWRRPSARRPRGQVRDRAQRALAPPQEAVRNEGDVAHVDARADDRSAGTRRRERDRHKRSDQREQDRGVEAVGAGSSLPPATPRRASRERLCGVVAGRDVGVDPRPNPRSRAGRSGARPRRSRRGPAPARRRHRPRAMADQAKRTGAARRTSS